jgi:hypothetical protein
MVPNVFIIIKKRHAVLAIKGEKKDETRGEEVRGRGGRKKREERGERDSRNKKTVGRECKEERGRGSEQDKRETERRRNQQRNRGPAENATPTEELSHHLLFLFQNEGNNRVSHHHHRLHFLQNQVCLFPFSVCTRIDAC